MSYFEHWQDEQDRRASAEWERTPEGRAERLEAENNRLREEKALLGQRRKWKRDYPTQWRAWQRLQPLLALVITFGDEEPFDFDTFRREVGPVPSGATRVVRKDKAMPHQRGNLRWGRPHAPEIARVGADSSSTQACSIAEKCRNLTKKEVAARLRVSPRQVNRWMTKGFLKPFRLGRVLRFRVVDVEAFEAKGRDGRR